MDRPRLATNPNEPLLHDIEVCGELLCQFRGADEFLPVYVQLGGGALSICAERAGGELISTARVPDLSRLLVRTPRTARAGRPHCLRVDLPDDEPDSRGVCKYIFDLRSAENLGKWQRGLSVRLSATQHALAGSGGNWWQDLKLNLNLAEDDELSREVSLELSPKARAMITHHKQAQLEVVHNSIVEARRRAGVAATSAGSSIGSAASAGADDDWVCVDDASAYKNWLQRSMPQDFDNEFVACSRRNEALHEIWDKTQASDGPTHIYTDALTNHIDQLRVERMVKVEFSPLHELIQDADTLQSEGRTADAEEMYGWLIDRLMQELEAEPDPNKKKPLASKIRIIQGRMHKKGLDSTPHTEQEEGRGEGGAGGGGGGVALVGIYRVTSNGTPTHLNSAPREYTEGMAVEFLTSTGEWRRGQVHSVEDGIVTCMHTTDGVVGFKEVDVSDRGVIRPAVALRDLEPEPEPEVQIAEGIPPVLSPYAGSGAGLLRPTPKSRWQPDEQCPRCPATGCSAPEFTLTRRRHHCRGCGLVFCDRCSPETAIISAGLCPKSGVVGLEFGKPTPTIPVTLVGGKLLFGRASGGGGSSPDDDDASSVTRVFDVRGCTVERVQGRRTLRIVAAGAGAAGSGGAADGQPTLSGRAAAGSNAGTGLEAAGGTSKRGANNNTWINVLLLAANLLLRSTCKTER